MESLRRIYQRAGYQQAHSRHLSLREMREGPGKNNKEHLLSH